MKRTNLTLALILAGASSALAQAGPDADGDGLVTMGELLAVYPDLTEEQYAAADTNDDGALDESELIAAQEAGLIPTEM